jgi:adenosylhomocysteine nucleosidase
VLGILCGIEAEAKIARKIKGADVACAGARPQKARWLARELIQRGATKLLSLGIAGGLEPGLPVGAMIIGSQVISADSKWTCDPAWVSVLMRTFPEAHCGPIWGSETIVATAREKRAVYEKSRCLAVDMESQCAAQIAAEAGVPLGVVRVVCDSADVEVPSVVMAVIAEDGSIDARKALWHLARHPPQIPSLIVIMNGTGRAVKVLKNAARLLGE